MRDQYHTGHNEYTDMGECVTTLLKVQARRQARSGTDRLNIYTIFF